MYFCKIIAREHSGDIVFEDENFICFLDYRPVFPGHCLLTPKQHINTYYDLTPEQAQGLATRAQFIGKGIEKALSAEGSFIAINNKISQSVPHVHMHLIPRNKKDGLKGFFWPRQNYKNLAEKQEIIAKITKGIESCRFSV